MSKHLINAVDLFAGAGGTSTGMVHACESLGLDLELLAINHWDIAIQTHSHNMPSARHMCTGIDLVDPRKAVKGGRVQLLVASPECTHHSNARGGTPMSDQSRASAWHIIRWATDLYIDNILIENVREFQNWGPLGADNRPLVRKRGQTFLAFIAALESLGYMVDWRVLNAADYGDPTSRERLFIMARRGGRKIVWPEPSHSRGGKSDMFGGTKPWKAAREIIDWSIKGKSIFNRKKPLSPTTINRIKTGLTKFGGVNAEPFLIVLRNHGDARSLNEPLPTLTASGQHFGLCEPFILPQFGDSVPRSIDRPLGTITTTSCGIALVEPFVVTVDHTGDGGKQAQSLNNPLPTVTGKGRFAVVEPFFIRYNGGRSKAGKKRVHSVNEPVPTIAANGGHYALVEPFLMKYYGNGENVKPISDPLDTITTKDTFGLVEPVGLDIRFRMLQPHELAKAMSFPDHFEFSGSRENKVKQIGNAVPVNLAAALCQELLRQYAVKRKAA